MFTTVVTTIGKGQVTFFNIMTWILQLSMLYNDYLLFWEFLTDLNNVILRVISIM
ncbi:hypothetical protein RO3G_17198 [Rhizopus delemar RA 99-880]|uniref:Uncharacterized protein n=1 Tax=Rhizopus delemar (strain RA 99-880 / ATCC MYA-4621 / FGSC 9543 / NRRL 43880) TaxID=246409 RepID=I1CV47_RHIO9|nr:hypothetical protein RO3G_17198 [Rhizopus delemar RA 99-880]|eukprot:EIE92327.1 hypothetical protein RO3G_17198 [Rhizopus delemar RA 99-880]